jgi:hypothetical protein
MFGLAVPIMFVDNFINIESYTNIMPTCNICGKEYNGKLHLKWHDPEYIRKMKEREYSPGPKNGSWKENPCNVSYHNYIKRRKPRVEFCESCGEKKFLHLSNKNGHKYSRNPDDYWWLCAKCHWHFDKDEHIDEIRLQCKNQYRGENGLLAKRQEGEPLVSD